MNDKIGITTSVFEKNNQFEINFSNPIIDYMRDRNIGTQNDYEIAYLTKKVYCNTDIVNLSLNNNNLKIEFNPNRITKTLPNEVLSYEKLIDSFNMVESELIRVGINTNLSKQPIYRFHSSFDIITDKQYSDYIDLIKLNLPMSKKVKYDHQFSIENTLYKQISKNQEICCYDKKALYSKMNDTDLPNTLRLEYRNENEIKEKRLSLLTLPESRYYQIRNNHKKIIQTNIFRDYAIQSDNLINLIYDLVSSRLKPDKLKNYLLSYLLNEQISELNIDIKDLLFSPLNKDDTSYKRAMQRLIKVLNDYSVFDLTYSRELYNELVYKLQRVA